MLSTRLLALAALALSASPALAGTSLGPLPPIVGDGVTTATFAILTDNPAVKIKVKPSLGKLESIVPVAGGYRVTWVAPAVLVPTNVEMTVQVRGAEKLDLTGKIQVVPGYTGGTQGFSIELDPPLVMAGESAQLKLRPIADAGAQGDKRVIRATASTGELTDLINSGDGTWVGRYTAPKNLDDPVQAVIAIADAGAPWELTGLGVIPVSVERAVAFDAPAGSNNVLVLGGREYGPNAADASGRVSFTVKLDPSQPQAQLQTVASDGTRTDTTVDMPMQVDAALSIAPPPSKAPGGLEVELRAYCVAPIGAPCDASQISWTATNGRVLGSESPAEGVSVARIEVPDEGTLSVTASLGEIKAMADIAALPSNVTVALTADPPALGEGERDFSISARLKDPRGTGVIGRMPIVEVADATVRAKLKDNKDGTYTASYRLNSADGTAQIRVSPPLQPSGLAPRRLVVYPESAVVAADGRTQTGLVVVAEDVLGLPVPNVKLTLSVPVGDGAVPPSATTGDTGVVRVPFTAGNESGQAIVVVEGAGLSMSTSLWQSVQGVPVPDIAPTGGAADIEAIARWRTRAPSVVLGRAAAPAAVAVAAPVAAAAPAAVPGAAVQNPATAAAPAAAPGQTASVSKPPKTPSTSDSPMVRIRAGMLTGPFSYSSVIDGTSEDYPTEAGFKLGGLFGSVGFDGGAEGWFLLDQTLGADVRVKLRAYNVTVGDDDFSNMPIDLHIGPRYKFFTMDNIAAYGGLAYFQTSEAVFAYANELKSAGELQSEGLAGARLAAGFRFEKDAFLAQLEVSEAFALAPSVTQLDATIDIPVPGSMVGITLGGGLDIRYPKLSLDDGSKLKVSRSGQDLHIGLFVPLL